MKCLRGGLVCYPKALTCIPWKLRVFTPQSQNSTRIGDFLILNFWCILPPMIHPIIDRVSEWTRYFQPTMWEPRNLSLRGIGAGWFVYTRSRCSLLKRDNNLWEPSNSWDVRFVMTYRLKPTWRWSNTISHTSGNIRVVNIYLEGLVDMATSNWLTSMVENNS